LLRIAYEFIHVTQNYIDQIRLLNDNNNMCVAEEV